MYKLNCRAIQYNLKDLQHQNIKQRMTIFIMYSLLLKYIWITSIYIWLTYFQSIVVKQKKICNFVFFICLSTEDDDWEFSLFFFLW